jgi:DNA helicase-4
MKNERQLRKTVRSAKSGRGATVKVLYVDDAHQIPKAIGSYLRDLASAGAFDTVTQADGRKLRVDVLGRYNFDRQLMPPNNTAGIDVGFRTVHSSKGLEADYVVIPNLTRGTHGFPSEIADDPVLDLVMAEPDDHPHAEERRLFYVALTRARREVVLVALNGKESTFLRELIEDEAVEVLGDNGSPAPTLCPGCAHGILVLREGPYGQFYGCNTFPRCRHSEKVNV